MVRDIINIFTFINMDYLLLFIIILGLTPILLVIISNYRFTKNVVEPANEKFFKRRAEHRENKILYEEKFPCEHPRESMGREMCSRECEHFDRIWHLGCDIGEK